MSLEIKEFHKNRLLLTSGKASDDEFKRGNIKTGA